MHQYDLICIGSGPAAEKGATQAAYFDHKVAIVERCGLPGGAMVNTGTIPSKALRETALLCSAFKHRPLPGLNVQIDRHLSVAKFMARRLLIQQQEHDRIEKSMDGHGIEVHRGFGRIVDGHTVEILRDDGSTHQITSKFILIATGSSPVRPDFVPFDRESVVDADGVLELDHLPDSLIVVGGGVIGSEYASIFAEIGVEVTLVHPRDSILGFIDEECRHQLMQAMQNAGVIMRMEQSVEKITRRGNCVEVTLGDGSMLSAEILLWAAGRSGNTSGMGLEAAGIEVDERGNIEVNADFQTTLETVYAAGDVIGFPALAATSMEQGRVAACHMFSIPFKQKVAQTVPMGIYTIPAVSTVGRMEDEAIKAGHSIVVGRAPYRNNARGRMLGDEDGLCKCVFDRDTRELVGCTIVGEQATELIHIAQVAITNGTGIDEFIQACFTYPSLTELFKYAAYSALQQLATQDGQQQAA